MDSYSITSPEDLFKHNIDMNFKKLDFRPLMINHEFENECASK